MELKINELVIPDRIEFNYEELKKELSDKVKMYETLVYTEEEIRQAKADRANLNKLKTALNDERKRREAEYMRPFEAFKAQINEIISIIDKPIALIDAQVKEVEEKRKAEKRVEIGQYFTSVDHPDWLTLPQIFYDGWLNVSYSMKQVQADIDAWMLRIKTEMETLSSLPEFSFEAMEVYKTTLNINKAISEGKRLADIQKRKEVEKKSEDFMPLPFEPDPTSVIDDLREEIKEKEKKPVQLWVSFSALLTGAQAVELKKFFDERGIQFKRMLDK